MDAANELRKRGRGNDTILAHINPREAMMLKQAGGSGAINPKTGLPEFDDAGDWASFNEGAQAGSGYGGVGYSYNDADANGGGGGTGMGGSPGPGQQGSFDPETGQQFGPPEASPDETEANMREAFARDQDYNQGPSPASNLTDFYYNATNPGKYVASQVGQFVDNFKNDPWSYVGNMGLTALAAFAPPAAVGLKGLSQVNSISGAFGGPTVGGAMSSVASAFQANPGAAPAAPPGPSMVSNDPLSSVFERDPLSSVGDTPQQPGLMDPAAGSLASLAAPAAPSGYSFVRYQG